MSQFDFENDTASNDEELPPDHRSGYVAIIGRPNVGKSTLLNHWVEARIAAVSPKPQTTRNSLLGILTRPDAQVIFVDTPGIHAPHNRLGEFMVQEAQRALPDADVVLFVVDVSTPPDEADIQVAQLLAAKCKVPVIQVLNKADLVDSQVMPERRQAYEALGAFAQTVLISAKAASGCDELLAAAIAALPQGPRYYPEDQLSDQEERFVAGELIRESALRLLEKEVPHALAVMVIDFQERPNNVLYISAQLFVERDSQKGIVIGKNGAMLKRIGQQARQALEEMFECRVFLELWVKVRKNWRKDDRSLRQFGYSKRP
jgi:GTP-binding protein Era